MKAEQRKEEIIACAKKVFSAKGGYYETYVEDIIKEAKIGKGTFYQYYKNKEELFIAVLEKFLDEWEVHVTQSLRTEKEIDSFIRIRIFISKTFEFFQQNDSLCNIYLCNGPGLNPIFESSINQFEERILAYIVTFIKDSMHAGIIREDLDLEIAANIFLGAFLRLAYFHFVLHRKTNTEAQLEWLTNHFFNIAVHGIAKNQ